MTRAGVVGLLALIACGERATAPGPVAQPGPAPAAPAPTAADLDVLPLTSRAGVDDRDPLPPGGLSRIGTLRFRADEHFGAVRFLGDAVLHEHDQVVGFDRTTGRRRFAVDQSLVMAQSEDGRLAVTLAYEDDCQGLRLLELPSGKTLVCRRERDDDFDTGNWALSDRGGVLYEVRDSIYVLDERLQTVGSIDDPAGEELGDWAISADGSVAAAVWRSPEYRFRLTLHALPGGEPLPVPEAVRAAPGPVAMSADGRVLAVQRDKDVLVLDRGTGRTLATLPVLGSRMKLSRDGSLLVQVSFASEPDAMIMWQVAGGKRLWTHALDGFAVYADDYDFSSDGTHLAYMISNVIRVVDARTGHDLAGIGGPVAIRAAALSADGQRVATASLGWVALWDAATGALVGSVRAGSIDGLQFARDGRWLYGFAGREALVRFPLAAGDVVRYPLPEGCGSPRSLQLPDGRTWILECDDGLAVWQAAPARVLRRVKLATRDAVHAIAMNPAGTRVAVVSDDLAHGDVPSGSLRIDIVDTKTWAVQSTAVEMSVQGVTMALLPDGTILLDRTLLDPATGAVKTLGAHLVTTTLDGTTALMTKLEEPYGMFLWRLDRPLVLPRTATPRDDRIRGVSAGGRLLECDWYSTCQVRTLP